MNDRDIHRDEMFGRLEPGGVGLDAPGFLDKFRMSAKYEYEETDHIPRYRYVHWVLLSLTALLLSIAYAPAQEGNEQVLVGTLDTKTNERQVFAFDARLVKLAANARSPVVARAFVTETSKKDCCKPVKVSSHVWKCCDGRYIVTTNEEYWGIVGEIHKTTDQEWKAAQEGKFKNVEGWESIASRLRERPPVELKRTDPRFDALPWTEIVNFKDPDRLR